MFDSFKSFFNKPDLSKGREDSVFAPQSEQRHSFDVDLFRQQRAIQLRQFNDINIVTDIVNEATRDLRMKLEMKLLSGREERTVEKTYELPQYRKVTHFIPRTPRDAFLQGINFALCRVNQWLCNVRFSGWLFSPEPLTEVERWFREFRFETQTKTVTEHVKTGSKTIETVVTSKRYCPHHHASLERRDCIEFLEATNQTSDDASFIRASIPWLEEIMKDYEANIAKYMPLCESTHISSYQMAMISRLKQIVQYYRR